MTWPTPDRWRAPISDWPPPWATSWGSDRHGLWADLAINGVAQRLRWIEPSGPEGFLMGDLGGQLHKVVDTGFWLADTPCTQAFWVQVAESRINPSWFQEGDEARQLPVENVSWNDVQQWLGRLARLCPATASLIALPTEVQWEYACRAGNTTAYWWGDAFDPKRTNTDVDGDRKLDGSKGSTTPVKHYVPNPWGLFDMHGNVWEWCDDAWRDRLDGVGESKASARAVRGGSWIHHPGNARSAFRSWWLRRDRRPFLSFRVSLRTPGPVPGSQGPKR